MKDIITVGIGSFIGGAGRYYVSTLCLQYFPLIKFPIATLIVNLLGCFLIGVLAGTFEYGILSEQQRLLFIIGILGGFTIFSAFGLETIQYINAGKLSLAIIYVISSVLLSLLAVWLGQYISSSIN